MRTNPHMLYFPSDGLSATIPSCSEPLPTAQKVPSMLPIIFSTLLGSTSFAAALLQARTVTSPATCQSGFDWMDNAEHSSPCLVVAELNAICNNNQWTIPVLNATSNYDNPSTSKGTVSPCTCSWASYNLISACAACQGFPEKNPEWTVYSANCSGDTSSTYFPSSITLPAGTTIPFWAGTNPTEWTNGIFNTAAAQSIANQTHADLGAPPPSHKKSNVGAIVGGVIGGLVVIVIASAIAFYILRRHRKLSSTGAPLSLIEKPHHMRSISDLTTNSGMQGYTTLSSTPMNPPTSPTIMTHQSSIRSVPYFSSVVASTVPQGTSSPPPLPTSTPPPPRNREDVIEPFILPPSHITDRKQSNGAYPVYDPPTAPPLAAVRNMEISRPATPTQRTRYNPPTYSESTTGGPSNSSSPPPSRPLHRGKQGSTDTLPSITSSRANGQRPTPAHSPNSSASGMGNIVSQMEVANPGTVTPPTHGRQVSGSRDEKRQPTEDSFNLA